MVVLKKIVKFIGKHQRLRTFLSKIAGSEDLGADYLEAAASEQSYFIQADIVC